MRICVFEDAGVESLAPLTLTRPAFDLWCGAGTLLQRQMRTFLTTVVGAVVRPPLAALLRLSHPALAVNDTAWMRQAPFVWVNARWLAPEALPTRLGRPEIGWAGDQVAYVVPPPDAAAAAWDDLPQQLDRWKQTLPHRCVDGIVVCYPWELIERNAEALQQDFQVWRTKRQCVQSGVGLAGPTIVGPPERLLVSGSAHLEAPVALDTTHGPILIDRQAVVQAFSRLEGPCYVGPRCLLRRATVRQSSLGPACRIGGEVEASIVQGYSNKSHDGFLGHSYVGEWVNLGAGTQVSDLRLDYRTVSVAIAGARIDTGRLKVGAYLGDHTRTGLNTLLNAGTVAGPFAQLLPGVGFIPREVSPFCRVRHGQVQECADLRQWMLTAATAAQRRGCSWTQTHEEFCFDLFERTLAQRRQLVQEHERRRLKQVI